MSVGAKNRSVQVSGLFVGATLVLMGSNDGKDWYQLRDNFGNKLTFTSADLRSIQEYPQFIKPEVILDVDYDIVVSVYLQGTN